MKENNDSIIGKRIIFVHTRVMLEFYKC